MGLLSLFIFFFDARARARYAFDARSGTPEKRGGLDAPGVTRATHIVFPAKRGLDWDATLGDATLDVGGFARD